MRNGMEYVDMVRINAKVGIKYTSCISAFVASSSVLFGYIVDRSEMADGVWLLLDTPVGRGLVVRD
jgi:hypothetical protein